MLAKFAVSVFSSAALFGGVLATAPRAQLFEVLHRSTPVGFHPGTQPLLADFDGDGDLDAVFAIAASYAAVRPVLYVNDGQALFSDRGDRFPVGAAGTPVAVGDIDADGDPDVIAAAPAGSPILWRNLGDGTFTLAADAIPPVPALIACAALADVDGDLDLDLVFGTFNYGNRLFLNDGGGTFAPAAHQLTPEVGHTPAVALGDIDGDGDIDLAIDTKMPPFYGFQPTVTRIYRNDGLGTFSFDPGALPSAPPTTALALADLDQDGDLDLVVGRSGDDAIFLNDGRGRFRDDPRPMPFHSAWSNSIEAIDLDGDQDLDLAVFSSNLRIYLNDSSAGFHDATPPVSLLGEHSFSSHAAAGDLDRDGDVDFVADDAGGMRVWLGDGSAHMTEVTSPVPGHDHPFGQVLGDADGDGDLDLFLGGERSNPVCLGDGTGAFTPKIALDPDPSNGLWNALWQDFDSDGDLDVIANTGTSIELLLGEPGPRYVGPAPGLPPVLAHFGVLASGDIDSDGDLDVYAGGWGQDQQDRMFVNQGAASFTEENERLPEHEDYTRGAAFADLDADGDLDLVLAHDLVTTFTPSSRVYFNDGFGDFHQAGAELAEPGTGATGIVLGDVDGDLDLDLVLAVHQYTSGLASRVLLNDGSGSFVAGVPLPEDPELGNDWVSSLVLCDLDLDLDLDLIEGRLAGPPRALLNDGSGAFTVAEELLPRGQKAWSWITAGDVDLDGDIDLVAAGPSGEATCWSNLSSQLARVGVPRVGRPAAFDVYGRANGHYSLLGSRAAGSPSAPFGAALLDPAQVFFHANGSLDAQGRAREVYLVPPDPSLIGTTLYWQARLDSPARWTNLEKTTFTGL